MYRFLHSVAMAAVLAHMVFGCCLHHAHAPSGVSNHAAESAAHALSGCSHDHAACESQASGAAAHECDPEHEGCEKQECFFLKPDDSFSGDLCSLAGDGFMDGPIAELVGRLPGPGCLSDVGISFPVRLHLLKRVLLV